MRSAPTGHPRRFRARRTRRRSGPAGSCSSPASSRSDPESKEIAGEGIAEQTEQVFANLRAILEAAGSGLDRIVKTTVYLTNLDDFAGMNEVYARHVGDVPPARATVEVSALPSGALVEIEAVAASRKPTSRAEDRMAVTARRVDRQELRALDRLGSRVRGDRSRG